MLLAINGIWLHKCNNYMKILLINQTFAYSGGANVVCLNTGRILEQHGHEVVYLSQKALNNETTSSDKYFYEGPKNVVERFVFDYYNWRSKRQLKRLVQTEKLDIAHLHELGNISDSILPLLKKYKIPVILTVHDYHLVCPVSHFLDKYGNACEKCIDKRYSRCFINSCYKGSRWKSFLLTTQFLFRKKFYSPFEYFSGVVFVSNFSKNKNIEHDKRFGDINHKFIYNSAIDHTNENSISRGEYFIYFGRLSYEKGVEVLIKAFSEARGLKLKVVGSGPLENELKEISSNNTNIEFTGFKSGKELSDLIIHSSFVIVPSICYENNPMAVVEAYSYGKPVIGADSGAIPEIVTSNTGLLFKKNDVESLVNTLQVAESLDNEEYSSLSNGAKEFFKKHFSEEKYYTELMSFYNLVLNQYNRTR